jgi:hypothetical protein
MEIDEFNNNAMEELINEDWRVLMVINWRSSEM